MYSDSELKDPRELDWAHPGDESYTATMKCSGDSHSPPMHGQIPLYRLPVAVRELARRGTPIRAGELILFRLTGPMVENQGRGTRYGWNRRVGQPGMFVSAKRATENRTEGEIRRGR